MPDPENLENMTDQELLHEAVRSTEEEIQQAAWDKDAPDEEPAAEAEAEAPEQQADDAEQPRNDKGQFVSRETDEPQQAEQGEQEQPAEGEDGEAVPRWRMREIAEERRQERARADALQTELVRLQTQIAQQRGQPQQPQAPQQDIDPLLDPAGFANRLRADFQREIAMNRLNSNLEIEHLRHGETFERAYDALIQEGQRGNGALIDRLTRTGNPGESMVRWYKERELLGATGGDLNKFRETMRQELLKDPEFLQAAIEVVRAQATGEQPRQSSNQGNRSGRPNNITRLPPSLSRAPGGSPNTDPIDTDDSERAVFDYAFR